MARAVVDAQYRKVLEATSGKVKPLGFSGRGPIFRKLAQGNSAVIQFQRSIDSSANAIIFTVNLAVVCGAILEPGRPALQQATSIHAHLRERIGMLLPIRQDKLWEVTEATDVVGLSAEVSDAVANIGVPYIERYLDTNELIGLWKSGKSPGLTEKQRLDYLDKLTAGRQSEGSEIAS